MTDEVLTPDQISWFTDRFDTIASNIERVIQGKREVIKLVAMCLVAEGHEPLFAQAARDGSFKHRSEDPPAQRASLRGS